MSQINVNAPEPVERVGSGDRSAAAGINMITVLIVLVVLAVIAWYLFTGPLRSMSGGTTNINVNPTPVTINVNPPAQPQAPAPAQPQAPAPAQPQPPAGNTGTGNPPPANP